MTTGSLQTAIPAPGTAARPAHDHIEKGVAVIVLLVVACALVAARFSSIPYLWAAGTAIITLAYAAVVTRRPTMRALWVNLLVVLLVLGAAETYFWSLEPLERKMEYSEGFFIGDETLGYRPVANRQIHHRSYGGNRLLYDVTYAIDEQGLRIASPAGQVHTLPQACAAFFGDSFTFGEGMTNNETMPYQVWSRLRARLQVVNFGFLGYGPHQMLAALQQGQLETRGHCRPRYIVYQAIPTHVSRAAGLEAWDSHGPHYVLAGNDRVRLNGHFDDGRPSTAHEWFLRIHRKLHAQVRSSLEASALYRTMLRSHRPVNEDDVALFAAIVGAAKQSALAAFPNTSFHVLFWDYDDDAEVADQVKARLQAYGIAVHSMSTILPDFPSERARYEISPYDRHPNAVAHARIADYVVQHIISPSR